MQPQPNTFWPADEKGTRESYKKGAILPQAGGTDQSLNGGASLFPPSPARTVRSSKAMLMEASTHDSDLGFLDYSAIFTNPDRSVSGSKSAKQDLSRRTDMPHAFIKKMIKKANTNMIPPHLQAHFVKFDWLNRIRACRFVADIVFVFVWLTSILALAMRLAVPGTAALEARMVQIFLLAIVWTPIFVANHCVKPARKVNRLFDVSYFAFWTFVFVLAEINQREFWFAFTFFMIQVTSPSPLYVRNSVIFLMFALGFMKDIYWLKNGMRNEKCVDLLVDSGIYDMLRALNATETPTADNIDTWKFSQISQTMDCNSIAQYLSVKLVNTFIFMILGLVFDNAAKKNFLGMCALHQDKIAVLKELNDLQEFTDSQQQHLDKVLGKGGGSGNRISLNEVQFQEKLGQGSFGTVWKALQGGRLCAVKTLSAGDATEENIRRFAFEVEMMERLSHPSIVKCVFAVVTPPKLCLGLELAKCDLTYALKNGLFAPRETLKGDESDIYVTKSWHSGKYGHLKDMVTSIASALEYLHDPARLICHRDVKTDNCLVTFDHRCLLSDFGEAKKLDSNNTSVGTPYYVAPEVFRGDLEYGVEADVYSFGVLLGVCLYHGSVSDFFFWDRARKLSGYVVSQRVLSGWRPKFKPIFEKNLPTVVELIKRCWLNEPSERPTMKEIKEILADWEEERAVHDDAGSVSPEILGGPQRFTSFAQDHSAHRK
ncbi:hypothetical protein TL16_g00538 [Triparma laevis f. inornata]|uniref:Protein kinase domain-containing protein n=1 Tax=Triparma laevis f. inornata TaxID=1714386 RepID=A0A9W7DPF2_9STRA|nr:hypothetical protein TL16_g00538 [Triparma laevis f. inornata]